MDDLSALDPGGFDIVIQPVSTCYLPCVADVYREVARVVASGGLYISQHKQPASLQATVEPGSRGYDLVEPYYRRGPLPPVAGSPHRELGTLEFLHRWEELLGGMCRAGFAIEDLDRAAACRRRRPRWEVSHIAAVTSHRTCASRPAAWGRPLPPATAKGVWTPESRG